MTRYSVAEDRDLNKLILKITMGLKDGWKVVGGLEVVSFTTNQKPDNFLWAQVMMFND